MKISITTIISLAYSSFLLAATDPHFGVFSVSAENQDSAKLMVNTNSHAYLQGPMGELYRSGVFGEWHYIENEGRAVFKYLNPYSKKEEILEFRFDSKRRAYTLKISNEESGATKVFFHVDEPIPQFVEEALDFYPERIAQFREDALQSEKEREERKRFERERPEVEKHLTAIKKSPATILKTEYHAPFSTNPKGRALYESLLDNSINFTEETLIKLIEEFPRNDIWTISPAFSRRELTPRTIRTLYPEALELKKMTPKVLFSFIDNPNIPTDILEDLLENQDLNKRIRGMVENRLKERRHNNANNKGSSRVEERNSDWNHG